MTPLLTFFQERFPTPTGEMRILTDENGALRVADWDGHEDGSWRATMPGGPRIVDAHEPSPAGSPSKPTSPATSTPSTASRPNARNGFPARGLGGAPPDSGQAPR